jgi:hypothetical protein
VKYPIKNILLIVTAILLVGGAFYYAEYGNKQSEIYKAQDVDVSTTVTSSSQNEDTDADGAKDWEEVLAGTNPADPKSKPSVSKKSSATDTTKEDIEKIQPIDSISRDFFARYIELRQIGANTDTDSQNELAQKTVNGIVLAKPAQYKIEEIITKSDSSSDGLRQYAQEIGGIFKKYAINSRDEGQIALEAAEKEDPAILKEIDPIIVSYRNIINALIKVKAPKSIAILHLDLVNGMNGALYIAQAFRNSDADPLKQVQAIAYYGEGMKNLYNALNAIKSYLKYSGINENYF